MIKETDVAATVRDFAVFCDYIEKHNPKLTEARGELGKKACFEINSLLLRPRAVEGPRYLQPVYMTVNLFVHIALATGLFLKEEGKGGTLYLVPSGKLAAYQQLTSVSQYMFLFQAYWTMVDYEQLYYDTGAMFGHFMYTRIGLEALKNRQPGERIAIDIENTYDARNPVHRFFVGAGVIIYHLAAFEFWQDIEEVEAGTFRSSRKLDPNIQGLTITAVGAAMIQACLQRPYERYHREPDFCFIERVWNDSSLAPLISKLGMKRNKQQAELQPFMAAFTNLFLQGQLEADKIETLSRKNETTADIGGNVYILKVIYQPRRWRMIKVASYHTLHQLHEAIQEAFGFADDHLYAFFMSNKPWNGQAYWSPYGEDSPYANKTTIGSLRLRRGQKFVYLFDFGNEWKFDVQVEATLLSDVPPLRPVITDSQGTAPEQYPHFFDE